MISSLDKVKPLSFFEPSNSLVSVRQNKTKTSETFDEKTHRFNAFAEIPTRDGRVFDVQEPRVRTSFAWEQIFLVEMDLIERTEQYQLPFQVSIRWEEMFGHDAFPSEPVLFRMARTAIGAHLESCRVARGRSYQMDIIRVNSRVIIGQ